MNNTLSDQVAAFRYGLIAPIVCRQTPLLPGELKAYLEETTNQIYEIPGSTRNKVSTRTLERYLSLYRKGGYDALKPQPKSSKGRTAIPAPVLQQAIALRRERPERSVEQIIFMLEVNGVVEKDSLANSTLASLKPRDFYGELLRHAGEVPPYSVAKAKRLWAEVLTTRKEQGDKTLVIVADEAQEMSEAMLVELRFLVNHQMDSCSLFPLILVGQSELSRIFRLKKHEAIAQRISLQYHLSGLTADETKAYVRHQMQTAGMATPLFSDSAVSRVHAASQGIPRLINHFCSQALYDAGQRDHEVIEDAHISRVLADYDRQRGVAG